MRYQYQGKKWLAHRRAWTLVYGEIPHDMNVLHRCDNPPCINVEHLFLGTQLDNVKDMDTKGRRNVHTNGLELKTHCIKGHEFTAENTLKRKNNRRGCRECGRVGQRKYLAKKKIGG